MRFSGIEPSRREKVQCVKKVSFCKLFFPHSTSQVENLAVAWNLKDKDDPDGEDKLLKQLQEKRTMTCIKRIV